MSDAYTRLAIALSDEDFSTQLAELEAWILELVPDLDVQAPVLRGMLLRPLAARQAANENLVRVLRDYSLLSALPVDTIVDDATREAIRQLQVEEYGLTEVPASSAIGEIKLTFSKDDPRVIPKGTRFASGGQTFASAESYILKEAGAVGSAAVERILAPEGSAYVATIGVVAVTPGKASNIPAGSTFSVPVAISGLTQVVSVTNFVGGRDALDVNQLVDAFFDNRVQKSMGSRDQIVALIRSRDDLANVKQVGVVGFGDPEMHRDKERFVPGGGGHVDLYVASASFPSQTTQTLTAVAVARPDAGPQQYAIEVGRDIAPGFLEVEQVSHPDTGDPLRVVYTIRGVDNAGILGEQVPRLQEIEYGTFSRFQTATIIVEDPETPASSSSPALQCPVRFRYIPGISSLQSLVSRRQTRFAGGDTLVRAAFPMTVAMNVRMRSTAGTEIPEAEQLQQAILSEMARKPLRGVLYASDLIAAMSPFLRPTLAVVQIEFYGTLITPAGEMTSHVGTDELVVPSIPDKQITARTVAMYTTAPLIRFSVEQLLSSEIP